MEENQETKLPTICLNMIVKNESKVIQRLLNSVVSLVDSYCICDTGSTDNTIELIESFFEKHGIQGKIVKEPFQDFGYNRTFALNAAAEMPKGTADYLLLLDADMVLDILPHFPPDKIRKRLLEMDKYAIHLFQGSDYFNYKNVRIVRNYMGFTYWGVTHEYVNAPPGLKLDYGMFSKDELFIKDIGDGGSKLDKFERDIRLLKKGLEENPDNVRYTFYLANSYRDHGDDDLAIQTYKRRAELGGWVEEVWQSLFSIAKIYKKRGDIANAIYYYMEAYHHFPNRIENLYEIINHYRNVGHNTLAYFFYKIADESRKKWPTHDYLFTQSDIYIYKLDYEFSIIGYYHNPECCHMASVCMKILSCSMVEGGIYRNVLSNYKFYVKEMRKSAVPIHPKNLELLGNIGKELCIDQAEFVSSTPSIYVDGDGDLIVCLRYVNYRIDENGGYVNKEHITTKNVIRTILGAGQIDPQNEVWEKNGISGTEGELIYQKDMDGRYIGIEDVRIMYDSNKDRILYNGNRGLDKSIEPHSPSFHMGVEHGSIKWKDGNPYTMNSVILYYEKEHNLEKNWVLIPPTVEQPDSLKCIYKWNPLTIGEINDGIFKQTSIQTDGIPQFFYDLRGSTNGVIVDDTIWFISHIVSYEDRRYYYHVVVVLDRKTLRLKKYTPLWSFEKEKVEYTLGFIYYKHTNRFLIGYSTMDRETKYMLISKSEFDQMMITV